MKVIPGEKYIHRGNGKMYYIYNLCKVKVGFWRWKKWVPGVVYQPNMDRTSATYVRTLENFSKRFF